MKPRPSARHRNVRSPLTISFLTANSVPGTRYSGGCGICSGCEGASGLETGASGLQAVASVLERETSGLEAVASGLEAVASVLDVSDDESAPKGRWYPDEDEITKSECK